MDAIELTISDCLEQMLNARSDEGFTIHSFSFSMGLFCLGTTTLLAGADSERPCLL